MVLEGGWVMKSLYALLGMGGLFGALVHWVLALPAFIGNLFGPPGKSAFTSSFIELGDRGFPAEGLDGMSPFVFLITAALWFIPLRLLHDAIKGADKPDE